MHRRRSGAHQEAPVTIIKWLFSNSARAPSATGWLLVRRRGGGGARSTSDHRGSRPNSDARLLCRHCERAHPSNVFLVQFALSVADQESFGRIHGSGPSKNKIDSEEPKKREQTCVFR